jgi:hypothetical protein
MRLFPQQPRLRGPGYGRKRNKTGQQKKLFCNASPDFDHHQVKRFPGGSLGDHINVVSG